MRTEMKPQGSSNSAESRVLATFLTEMDGVGSLRGDNVIVVGATNRPEAVDRALLRPGRFDQVVYAPLPAEDARRQVIFFFFSLFCFVVFVLRILFCDDGHNSFGENEMLHTYLSTIVFFSSFLCLFVAFLWVPELQEVDRHG